MDHPTHQLAIRMLNAMYEATDRDADGQPSPEQQTVYDAAEQAAPSLMQLHRIQSHMSDLVRVEVYYFACPTCGHTIPAVQMRP